MKFSIEDFFRKRGQISMFLAGLVTFTEEILNAKLQFLRSGIWLNIVTTIIKIEIGGDQLYQDIQVDTAILRDTTRYYEWYYNTLWGARRYYKWYFESLRDTTRHSEYFCKTLRVTSYYDIPWCYKNDVVIQGKIIGWTWLNK